MAPEPPSPSPSTTLLPFFGGRSRRGSLASISSRNGAIDKTALAQALDNIHSSASQSEALTSFHDFDGGASRNTTKDFVSGSVSGLYNKLKQSVAGLPGKDDPPQSSNSREGSSEANVSRQGPTTGVRGSIQTARADSDEDRAAPTVGEIRTTSPPKGLGIRDRLDSSQVEFPAEEMPFPPRLNHANTHGGNADQSHLSAESYHSSDDDTGAGLYRSMSRTSNVLLADTDRTATATQALARVLSNHDARIPSQSTTAVNTTLSDTSAALSRNDSTLDRDTQDRHVSPTGTSTPGSALEFTASSRYAGSGNDTKVDERPAMRHIGVSHLPGFELSRTSSSTDMGGISQRSTRSSTPSLPSSGAANINSALQRSRVNPTAAPKPPTLTSVPMHLRRRVISKEFWMKDENARDCFYCGQAFSTFRRKHHCRTCGQIFDAQCTSRVPGGPFGQPGTIRLCKPCEAIIYGEDDDDSTILTEDGDERSPITRSAFNNEAHAYSAEAPFSSRTPMGGQTPSIGIPVSRRNREAKRRSQVIEFDAQPGLARPSSAHSLISLNRRARSSSHRRHHSRYGHLRNLRGIPDERIPFHQDQSNVRSGDASTLPVFHHDNIIDPDLAPFLSDQGSEDDESPSIMSAMNQEPSLNDRSRLNLNVLLASTPKRSRARLGDRGTNASSVRGQRDGETVAHTPKQAYRLRDRTTSHGSQGQHATLDGGYGRGNQARSGPPKLNGLILRSSAMSGGSAPPIELNMASLDHVRNMMSQMLNDTGLASPAKWHKALMPILLQCANDVDPDVPQGDDMDIRHYVKIKKIPGGKPGDTSYVSGIVFSKNVALKSMPTSISHPRIAIITFSLEYARHETHFLSLEPVIAQEREYLNNLVGRIVALKPQILLVQRNVSGLALDLLNRAGIAVVYNIKESVLAAVARLTQTPIIRSFNELLSDPSQLGGCSSFEVKTYLHQGVRKAYVFLAGCAPDLGCTIVLRGSDTTTLRSIKRITEFMCYVVYNLKLETSLMRDEFVSVPTTRPESTLPLDLVKHSRTADSEMQLSTAGPEASETVSKYASIEAKNRRRILSASPFVVFMQPYVLTQLADQERRLATYRALRDQYAAADEPDSDNGESVPKPTKFKLVHPEMIHLAATKDQPKAVREYLHAVHEAQLEKALHTFETQKRLWESFTSTTSDPFDPTSHQMIVVLSSTVSSITSAPCYGPELIGIEFYSSYSHVQEGYEEDCTLGQYIVDLCDGAGRVCAGCGKRMIDHNRQYVHGSGQLSITVQKQTAKLRGYKDRIVMWSACRRCHAETTVLPMSDNAWKYSFAKYLELSFWSGPLHPRAKLCDHDIHKDFVRCFELRGLAVRIQYDMIDMYELIVPRATITWRVEADLTTKNSQYTVFEDRLNTFVDSIHKRLDSITLDALDEKKAAEANDRVEELRAQITVDHQELTQKLQQKYASSRYYELIPLNRALRLMDEKAIEWDDAFANFEDDFFPSENDIRRLAVLQLKNMFLESQPMTESVGDASDAEDATEMRVLPSTPGLQEKACAGSLYADKAHDVMSASVEQHHNTQGLEERLDDKANGHSITTMGAVLNPGASPRQTHEQAVERDDIRHLDLAVAQGATEQAAPLDSDIPNPGFGPDLTEHENLDTNTFATPPKPLSSGLLERIEQIRSKRPPDNDSHASKIPRLVDLQRNSSAVPVPYSSPPPLLRAQSQPAGHIPRRSADLSSNDPHGESSVSAQPAADTGVTYDRHLSERLGVGRLMNKVGKIAPSLIPRSIPAKIPDDGAQSNVSALANHFEQLSREFENQRLRERQQRALRSRQARANPLASSRPVVEVYRNATDAVDDGHRGRELDGAGSDVGSRNLSPIPSTSPVSTRFDDRTVKSLNEDRTGDHQRPQDLQVNADSMIADPDGHSTGDSFRGDDPTREVQDMYSPSALSSTLVSPSPPQESDLHPELIPEHKKSVWFKYLADFWSKRSSSGWSPLEYPLYGTEHVFEDSDIIVREDEPSSVIALSLACADYQNKVNTFRTKANKSGPRHTHTPSQNSNFYSDVDDQQSAVEASLLSDKGTHMKYSFSHGAVRASCKIFYAEAFDALRRRCGIADRFVESMSRCLKYDSKGGKTKSLFLKTLDNRFIIKSLQEVELKAFTKFAPDYFSFMSYHLFHGVPSVIAKMFGVFQITIKNPATGLDFSYYLLVMENLFYERNPNRRFDLKGSMRNRKVESTGQPDEVLLDENLVETIFESPLFVREHARKLMQASVYNDTMWLCKQNVMDYSLMAGFDDERKELVVGIIDCIRTYTWDKKLESWIKDRGKNKPTITSPKDYRNRFRVSMMQYVLQAPSCWHQFQAQMAPPKTLKDREEGGDETYLDYSRRAEAA